jgi:transposase InsO family protein
MRVARHLVEEATEIRLGKAAKVLGVDVRTIWNWKHSVKTGSPEKKIGRPAYTAIQHESAIWRVGRELRRQGYPGWLAVESALRGDVPTRLIQFYVRSFKKKRSERKKARIALHRVEVEVTARDAIWGQDGTHVGRCEGASVESQVMRDRGSLSIIGVQTGEVADHEEIVALFESVAVSRAEYPLVWSRDNGSMYAHESVRLHMETHEVIELRSLPRTPEHNGAAENTNREIKDVAGLGKGSVLASPEAAHAKMVKAQVLLNKNRVRRSKGLMTADELDERLPSVAGVDRTAFYQKCRSRMRHAVAGAKTIRAGRMAEREAIFQTLEEYGLIKRTRGGKPYAPKSEIIL